MTAATESLPKTSQVPIPKDSLEQEDIVRFCQFSIPKEASVLVIGFNVQKLVAALGPSRATAIDLNEDASEKMLEIGKSDAKFDYIVLVHVLSYLKDIQNSLTELRKNTYPQTRLIILSHNYLWLPLIRISGLFKRGPQRQRQNWLSPYDIFCLLSLSGYELIRQGSRLLFPLQFPLISSFVNAFLAKFPLLKSLCLTQYYIARVLPSSSGREYSVSVVVPARNEKGNIEQVILRMPRLGNRTEIVFVEGHSKDETLDEIHRVRDRYQGEWDIKVVSQTGIGKADAVRRGFETAKGDILMILDADLTTPPEELPKFYEAVTTGKGELVMGSRLVYPLEKDSMRLLNTMGNKFFSLILSWILEVPIKDTLCGTKVISRPNYERICQERGYFGDFDPFGDFDLILGAAKAHLRILEIPIRYQARSYGQTNIRRFYHAWLLLKMSVFAFRKFKLV